MSRESNVPGAEEAPSDEPSLSRTLLNFMREQREQELRERRRERFWRNVRFGLIALVMLAGPLYLWTIDKQYNRHRVGKNYVALVRVDGVIPDGWGLDKLIERFGIERRVFTAGVSKSRLDTFKPLSPEDERKAQGLLGAVHGHFKSVVREGRGDRLKADEVKLFNGDFWTGDQALQLGLVDRLCDLNTLMADEFGATDARDYTPPPSFMSSIAGAIGSQVKA